MTIPAATRRFIRTALKEDIGRGDVTTGAIVRRTERTCAVLIAKAGFVLAGLPFCRETFLAADPKLVFTALAPEGERVRKGSPIASIEGRTASLLMAERTALNVIQRLSGIATLTDKFVRKAGDGVKVLDTRKTTPGMRFMEKYAVRMGGGHNHRMGLYDAVLIKDNHIRSAGSIARAVRLARRARKGMSIEVECESLAQVKEALAARADIVMLDNMPLDLMKRCARLCKDKAITEASGNVNLRNVALIAATGVDLISIGALTHSAPASDISMLIE